MKKNTIEVSKILLSIVVKLKGGIYTKFLSSAG
jgi:hypothetical protein